MEDVLAEIVESGDKYISPDEVKSILKLYELDTEKYEALLSEAGIEDASEVCTFSHLSARHALIVRLESLHHFNDHQIYIKK